MVGQSEGSLRTRGIVVLLSTTLPDTASTPSDTIAMAPIDVSRDYYAILEVSRTATQDSIKASYRRLALLHHPDKNGGARSATTKTQLVREQAIFRQETETTDNSRQLNEAWDVLGDSDKKREYDNKTRPQAGTYNQPQPKPPQPTPPQQPQSQAPQPDNISQEELRAKSESQKKRQEWLNWERLQEQSIRQSRIRVKALESEVAKLNAKIDENRKKLEKDVPYWWNVLASLSTRLTESEKNELRRETIQSEHAVKIKNAPLSRERSVLEELESALSRRRFQEEARLERERREQAQRERVRQEKAQAEAQRHHAEAAARKREEAAARQRAEAEAWAQAAHERDAADAKRASERAAAREKQVKEHSRKQADARKAREEAARRAREHGQRARENAQRACDNAQRAREDAQRIREQAQHTREQSQRTREAAQRAREDFQRTRKQASHNHTHRSTCRHKKWWNKIDGRHDCQHCTKSLYKWALQCSGCQTIGCHECMRTLKGGGVPTVETS